MSKTIKILSLYSLSDPDRRALCDRLSTAKPIYSKRSIRNNYHLSHDLLEIKDFTDFNEAVPLAESSETHFFRTYAVLSNKPIGEGGCARLFNIESILVVKINTAKEIALELHQPNVPWVVKRISTKIETRTGVEKEVAILSASEQKLCVMPAIKINHPNRYRVKHGVTVYSQYHYIPMTKIEGPTLDRIIREINANQSDFFQRLDWIVKLLQTYKTHIQQKDIVHLDIKPENIMVTSDQILIIIDFGLSVWNGQTAELTEATGSLPYCDQASFEQNNISTHTDVYALASIIGELLGAQSREQFMVTVERELDPVFMALGNEHAASAERIEGLLAKTYLSPSLKALIVDKLMSNPTLLNDTTSFKREIYAMYDFPELCSFMPVLADEIRALLMSACQKDLSQRVSLEKICAVFQEYAKTSRLQQTEGFQPIGFADLEIGFDLEDATESGASVSSNPSSPIPWSPERSGSSPGSSSSSMFWPGRSPLRKVDPEIKSYNP